MPYDNSDGRRYANFLFGWDLDNVNTRLVFYTVLDRKGRNIKPFGDSLRRYPRWAEVGYENDLMRWTDFANSQPLEKREQYRCLSRLCPMRPSEPILLDLWDVAKGYLPVEDFLRRYQSCP